MHELSIAQAVAGVALRHAHGRRVAKVELRLGALRQVVPDALLFAWELVTPQTPLAGSELEIDEVPVRVSCGACGTESEQQEFPLACTACGSLEVALIAGEELSVDALELEEQPMTSGGVR